MKTDFFKGTTKPIHVGFYERKYGSHALFMCWWNGKYWLTSYGGYRSGLQKLEWRGLATPPVKG